jgi:hypothetical protein
MNPLFYPGLNANANANSENATSYIIPDTSLRHKLRVLMTQYSAEEIHLTLQQIFQDDYAFYQSLFVRPSVQAQVQAQGQTEVLPLPLLPMQQQTPLTQVAAVPLTNAEAPILNSSKIRPDTRIRIVKKPTAEAPTSDSVTVLIQSGGVEKEDSISVVSGDREKKAQIKRDQAEKEAAKYKELISKGIDPESLLTKENLKKWIETDGLTYAQIARDHVGLSALQVSNMAKGFGLKSVIAKKRAMIMSSRK